MVLNVKKLDDPDNLQNQETSQNIIDTETKASSVETAKEVTKVETQTNLSNLKETEINNESNLLILVKQNLNNLKVWVYWADLKEWKRVIVNITEKDWKKNINIKILNSTNWPENIGGLIVPWDMNTTPSWIIVKPIETVPAPVTTVDQTQTTATWTTTYTDWQPTTSSSNTINLGENISTAPIEPSFSSVEEQNWKQLLAKNNLIRSELSKNTIVAPDIAASILNMSKPIETRTDDKWNPLNWVVYWLVFPGCSREQSNILVEVAKNSITPALDKFAAWKQLSWPEAEAIKKLNFQSLQYYFDTKMVKWEREDLWQALTDIEDWKSFEWWGKKWSLSMCKNENINSSSFSDVDECRTQVQFARLSSVMCRKYGWSTEQANWLAFLYLASRGWVDKTLWVWEKFQNWIVIPFCNPVTTPWTINESEMMNIMKQWISSLVQEHRDTVDERNRILGNWNPWDALKLQWIWWVRDQFLLNLKKSYPNLDMDKARTVTNIWWTVLALFAGFKAIQWWWRKLKNKGWEWDKSLLRYWFAWNLLALSWLVIWWELVTQMATHWNTSLIGETAKFAMNAKDFVLGWATNPDKYFRENYKASNDTIKQQYEQVQWANMLFSSTKDNQSFNVGELKKFVVDWEFNFDQYIKEYEKKFWTESMSPALVALVTMYRNSDKSRKQAQDYITDSLVLMGLAQKDEAGRIAFTAPDSAKVKDAANKFTWSAWNAEKVQTTIRAFNIAEITKNDPKKAFDWFNRRLQESKDNTFVTQVIDKIWANPDDPKLKSIRNQFGLDNTTYWLQKAIDNLRNNLKEYYWERLKTMQWGKNAQFVDINLFNQWIDNAVNRYVYENIQTSK